MNASKFNPDAQTPAELLGNVNFQLANVERWLMAAKDFPNETGPIVAARMKAGCLVEAAQKLHAALEAETRKVEKAEVAGGPPALRTEVGA